MRQIQLPNGEFYKIKRDRYQKSRGTPKILKICCSSCGELVLIYQKDGPGPLLRCYLDRIAWPTLYSALYCGHPSVKNIPNIACALCEATIATPVIYEKENRLAYHMIPVSFQKKLYK